MSVENGFRADKNEIILQGVEQAFAHLSPQDLEVLQYKADGLSREEISRLTGVDRKTVARRMGKIKGNIEEMVGEKLVGTMLVRMVRYGMERGILDHDAPEGPYDPLEPMEFEVCKRIFAGMSGADVSRQTSISKDSYEDYVGSLRKKLKVSRNEYNLGMVARLAYMKKNKLVSVKGR